MNSILKMSGLLVAGAVVALAVQQGLRPRSNPGNEEASSTPSSYTGHLLFNSDALKVWAHEGVPVSAVVNGGGGGGVPGIHPVQIDLPGVVIERVEAYPNPSSTLGYDIARQKYGPFPTPYSVDGFAARTPEEIYVFGFIDETQVTVVELLSFPPETGGYFVTRAAASDPIGVPVSTPPPVLDVVGGSYVKPSSRTPVAPLRQVVVQDGAVGRFADMAVDPDGRFLLALTEAGQLVQWPLPGGPASVLYDSSSLAGLADADVLLTRDHDTEGRVYHARSYTEEFDG